MIQLLQITLFLITFYFTIIVMISKVKWFNANLKNVPQIFGIENNDKHILNFVQIFMWVYQIYFWFTKLELQMYF